MVQTFPTNPTCAYADPCHPPITLHHQHKYQVKESDYAYLETSYHQIHRQLQELKVELQRKDAELLHKDAEVHSIG